MILILAQVKSIRSDHNDDCDCCCCCSCCYYYYCYYYYYYYYYKAIVTNLNFVNEIVSRVSEKCAIFIFTITSAIVIQFSFFSLLNSERICLGSWN